MSIPGAASPLFLATTAGGAAEAFEISRSLRFNSADSANLSRTPSSASNRKTWTWSGWVKRSQLGVTQGRLFGGGTSDYFDLYFPSGDELRVLWTGNSLTTTTAVFRDPSAWYHIVLAVDTTQSTANDRIKMYVNGALQDRASTNPSQNYDTAVNNNVEHHIGRYAGSGGSSYFNGYLAEVNFIDGQALAASDFGEYDANGVWQAKEFAGSYTLPASGVVYSSYVTGTPYSSLYTADQAFDGNADTNNMSLAVAGGTMTFTAPTAIPVTSSLRIWGAHAGSGGDLTINGSSVGSQIANTYQWNTITGVSSISSIAWSSQNGNSAFLVGAIEVDGTILVDGTPAQGTNSFRLPFTDNSSNQALGYDGTATTPTLNPKGGMDVVTYTGNSSARDIGGLLFAPDLVIIKARNAAYNHYWVDSVRGTNKNLYSNSTEATQTADRLSSFNSDGFGLTNHTGVNNNGTNYVAWAWKAGGAAVSNTDGSGLTNVQVSANTSYGFSIVTYTGGGSGTANSDSGDSFGHGLSSAPKLVICKRRNSANGWPVYHASTALGALSLNGTNALDTGSYLFAKKHTSSSVVYLGNNPEINATGSTYVAYCWSEVAGFSKFGSFTSATGGTTVNCGFKPRYILFKSTGTGSWAIHDAARNGFGSYLLADTSGAEGNNSDFTVTDTGFTFDNNSNGTTFIYAVFADRPGNNWTPNNLSAASGVPYSSYLYQSGSTYDNTTTTQAPWYGSSVAANAFDGSTSSIVYSSAGGGWLYLKLPTGITGVNTVEIYGGSEGNSEYRINGTAYTPTSYSNWGTITLSNATVTEIAVRGGSPSSAYSGRIHAIKINGSMLIDGEAGDIDSLVDTPSNAADPTDSGIGGEIVGNYATLNPLDNNGLTLSNGNLDASRATNSWATCKATFGLSSDKWYFEYTVNSGASNQIIGVFKTEDTPPAVGGYGYMTYSASGWGYQLDGNKANSNSFTATGTTAGVGDNIMVAVDVGAGKIWFGVNGTWLNSGDPANGNNAAFTNLSGSMSPAVCLYGTQSGSINFGQRSWVYSAPSGYKAINTASLPTPTIADGSKYFDTKLYTGNDGTQTISGFSFAPGWVWIKSRSSGAAHCSADIVVGANKHLLPNETVAEATGLVPAFTSDGFTVNNLRNGADNGTTNDNNLSYVSWVWDGGTSTVTNNDGSIASQVRANPSAGFSICTYTGNGSGGASIGHGLNAGVEFLIVKDRSAAASWHCQHSAIGNTSAIFLNSTSAAVSNGAYWNNTSPTSSVFTVGTADGMNGNGNTYVAYCFAPVNSYSAMGSYTGNGSSDGPFIHTGFKVAWLLTKRTDGGSNNWQLIDSARSSFNVADDILKPDESAVESSHADYSVDFLSNGFKHRTGHVARNGNGNTYIYVAFASNPFQANGGLAR